MIEKTTDTEVTREQLDAVNRFTRRTLTKDEVFVFPVVLCDNEVDRDLEQFPRASLGKLASLYMGKTGVFDHKPNAANQSARIFAAEVVDGEGTNSLGEPYCQVKAWAYMLRSAKNADLILEIDAGIKKEVSVERLRAREGTDLRRQALPPPAHQPDGRVRVVFCRGAGAEKRRRRQKIRRCARGAALERGQPGKAVFIQRERRAGQSAARYAGKGVRGAR
ncbi:MAG: hypothetical protein LBV27_03780 [Oscillospiraceae bacterium]|jgi:hypothetical protein|nr:hypothetical protein [Oscillospiraceae bacterium]